MSIQIRTMLANADLALRYPAITGRFYSDRANKPAWSVKSPDGLLWSAMLFLDCAIQYGLSRGNYHAAALDYRELQKLAADPDLKSAVRFEILLTDAMIAYINDLHYGKLNPEFPAAVLEKSKYHFADSVLSAALAGRDFKTAIESAQPVFAEYRLLQDYMRLVTGQYTGDSYQTNEQLIRTIAANMERWRWEKPVGSTSVEINVPSYTLTFRDNGKNEQFKVIVGKPASPTPVLVSQVTHFTTAPDWNIPARIFRAEILPKALKNPAYMEWNHYQVYNAAGKPVPATIENLKLLLANKISYVVRQSAGCDNALGNLVFRFANPFSIYLHDTPSKNLFNSAERALSHGCIRVEHPDRLAIAMLKADRASAKMIAGFEETYRSGSRKTFRLDRPVPITIRYFTCEIRDGVLMTYIDVYQRDQPVSESLLGTSEHLTAEIAVFVQRKQAGFAPPQDLFSVKN